MTSPSLRLLARIAPLVAVAVTACGGETVAPVGNTGSGDGGSAGSGSTTGGASGRAPQGGQAGASAGGTTGLGLGGSAGTGTAGTTSAGTGGATITGTGGTTTIGSGGTSTGDSGAGGASDRCKVLSGCGDVCYERVDAETCLKLADQQAEVFARLGCTGQTWGSGSTTPTSCCYLMGQCGVGRPITIDGIGVVAGLVRGEGW